MTPEHEQHLNSLPPSFVGQMILNEHRTYSEDVEEALCDLLTQLDARCGGSVEPWILHADGQLEAVEVDDVARRFEDAGELVVVFYLNEEE